MPLRLAYRGATNAFALLRLLPLSDRFGFARELSFIRPTEKLWMP
ncbi:hypothetical protein AB0A74_20265 [Saccharothrix sp. NPDC042600]|nr:hypothetical protein GCM10017745_75140 [Saccharothrix mutabilis subsp. capreolus]